MEWCSASNPRKKFKKNHDTESKKAVRVKSLLDFFIEYIWNDSDGECTDSAESDLISWFTSQELNIRNSILFDDGVKEIIRSNQKRFRRTELPDNAKSHVVLQEICRDLNNQMKFSELAVRLRKILPLFINRKDVDVNHVDHSGQFFLHFFIDEYLGSDKYLTINQISRLPKFVKNLVGRWEGLFYEINSHGKTPLDVAANCKNKKVLEIITANLADVRVSDENGNTALHIVVNNCIHEKVVRHKFGYLNIVRNLVSRGADVNIKNKEGLSAVQLASMKFHILMLKYFANNGADFKQHTPGDENALHLACKSSLILKDTSKMVRTINFLVKKGCHIESYDKKGCVPLHHAAEYGTVEVIESLIGLGATVDCRTRDMLFTPLYLASKANRLDNIKALVKAGADVNAEAADGSTPIFMCVLFGSFESLEYLANHGANLYKRDGLRGLTLLHYATNDKVESTSRENDITNDVKLEERNRKFNFLVDKNFDVNDPGNCGITPLQLAAVSYNVDIVKKLIERGANVNFQSDNLAITALHLAVIQKDSVIAKLLIDNGADVNRCGVDIIAQISPLHMALSMDMDWIVKRWYNSSDAVIEHTMSFLDYALLPRKEICPLDCQRVALLLIENRAEINVKDKFGKTPLHLATIFKRNYATRRLLASGSHVNIPDFEGRLPLQNILQNSNTRGFKLLLKFGADINEIIISEQIMNSSLKGIAIEHAIKLNLVGLPIATTYELHILSLKYSEFYEKCVQEVRKLQEHHYHSGISFYRFLRMDMKTQYRLIRATSNCDNFEKLFPLYSSVIQAVFRESAVRNSLLKTARNSWNYIIPIHIPKVCIEIILSHLSNRYLEEFTAHVRNDH